MGIPQKVVEASRLPNDEIKHIRHLGKYKGKDAYVYSIPNAETGFPFIYLFEKSSGIVNEVTGFDGLRILGLFFKN